MKSNLRSLAHLEEQLGGDRFQALISPYNTGEVMDFCDRLIAAKPAMPQLPTEMTVGGRTYEILSFLKDGEERVSGDVMVSRAKEMNAYLGKEDCEHILTHQNEIPTTLHNKIIFVFPDMRDPDSSLRVAYLDWGGGRWIVRFDWLDGGWSGHGRLLRRK